MWHEIAHKMMCTFRICEHVTHRRWCRRQLSNGIVFIPFPPSLPLHFILSLFISRSFFSHFLSFSFTFIVSIFCLTPHKLWQSLSLFSSCPFLLFLLHLHRANFSSLFFSCPFPLVLFTCIRPLFFHCFPSSLCLSPPHSFYLFPFPAPFFVLCGFSSGPVVPCTSKKYACRLRSLFVPAAFRTRLFRFLFVPVAFRSRLLFVPVAFPFRFLFVPVTFPFPFLFVPVAFRTRLLFVLHVIALPFCT